MQLRSKQCECQVCCLKPKLTSGKQLRNTLWRENDEKFLSERMRQQNSSSSSSIRGGDKWLPTSVRLPPQFANKTHCSGIHGRISSTIEKPSSCFFCFSLRAFLLLTSVKNVGRCLHLISSDFPAAVSSYAAAAGDWRVGGRKGCVRCV